MAQSVSQTPSQRPVQSVVERLDRVRDEIAAAARAVGREPSSVTLIAVSKGHSAEEIVKVIGAGQRVFGENRVQEAQAKWPELRHRHPGLELHMIGPLQTNKVRDALALFDVIQSLDRPKLADILAAELARGGRRPGLFIQVNTGEELQKSGVLPKEAPDFIAYCRDEKRLPIRGLMAIPPADDDPALHFALLRELARNAGLTQLSMGMSADYPVAVRFGATHVRVGTAVFGARPRPPRPALEDQDLL
jgi:pyridoxal phosphate enzyme (YggS family)